jgi:hypothetical protein
MSRHLSLASVPGVGIRMQDHKPYLPMNIIGHRDGRKETFDYVHDQMHVLVLYNKLISIYSTPSVV